MGQVYDIVKDRRVYSIDADSTVLEAARFMMEHNIGALPVLRDGVLAGIVSERDIMNRVVAVGRTPGTTAVSEVMTANPRAVDAEDWQRAGASLDRIRRIIAVNLPFVVLTLQSVLEGIDRSSEEAALSLGATPFAAWRLVSLPLAIPGVLAAAGLCFILTMNAYATPVLLGGPRFQMMAPVVANEVLNQNNWPFGAALSFMLMIVTLLLTVIANVVVARRYSH